jgi:hypothetical protein
MPIQCTEGVRLSDYRSVDHRIVLHVCRYNSRSWTGENHLGEL